MPQSAEMAGREQAALSELPSASKASATERELERQLRALLGDRFRATQKEAWVGYCWPLDDLELSRVMALTERAFMPVVARGLGTSPYGASTAERGVVVNTRLMDRVLDVDVGLQEARVQAGVKWDDLLEALSGHGLMARIYPSSLFSTVGGFIAQGGVGVGSYQFGPIERTVKSVRTVNPNGDLVEHADAGVELVVGMAGRTGIVSDVTLKLQPAMGMIPVIALFEKAESIEGFARNAPHLELSIWSMAFADPVAISVYSKHVEVQLGKMAGHFAVVTSIPETQRQRMNELATLIASFGGRVVHSSVTHDWCVRRFMEFQRLKTTRLPQQFQIPTHHLGRVLREIGSSGEQLACEGVFVSHGRDTAIRCFLPRKAFGSLQSDLVRARKLLQIVKALGGTSYATGEFFAEEASSVYGIKRLASVRNYRKLIDPRGRLNPGRVFY